MQPSDAGARVATLLKERSRERLRRVNHERLLLRRGDILWIQTASIFQSSNAFGNPMVNEIWLSILPSTNKGAKETLALRLDKFSKVSKYTGRHSKHEA